MVFSLHTHHEAQQLQCLDDDGCIWCAIGEFTTWPRPVRVSWLCSQLPDGRTVTRTALLGQALDRTTIQLEISAWPQPGF